MRIGAKSKAVTDEQRIQFEANGFLILPEALSPPELPGVRAETLEQVQAPIEYDDRLLALLWHPRVFPLVRALLGEDVSMIDNDYFITPPRTPRTHAGWHHDVGLRGVYHPRSTMMVK